MSLDIADGSWGGGAKSPLVENQWFEIRGIAAIGVRRARQRGQLAGKAAPHAFDRLVAANGCALTGPQQEATHWRPDQHNQGLVC